MCGPGERSSEFYGLDASGKSTIAGRDQFAAGTAHHILGDLDTVASETLVGVNGMTGLANTAHFSGQVADAHFLGSGSGQRLARTESGKYLEGLGFGVDKQFAHSSYLS